MIHKVSPSSVACLFILTLTKSDLFSSRALGAVRNLCLCQGQRSRLRVPLEDFPFQLLDWPLIPLEFIFVFGEK